MGTLTSTIVRLIQRRAFPNLRNIIAKTHSADIARWFPRLRTEAKSSLFKTLVEEKRMGEVLRDLNSADISEFVEETEPSVVADITGALLGTAYGLLLGGFASLFPHFREHAWKLPLVVALAIFVNMIIAATVGTLIPMLFKRIRVDPAVATGPFVTTAIDVAGIFTYFFLAKIFLPL